MLIKIHQMKTILLPVDFSDHSIYTYKYAIKIAGTTTTTKLYFQHSFNDQLAIPDASINTGFDNETFLNMQLVEEFRKQAINNMKKLKNEVEKYLKQNELTNFIIETDVMGGDPGWEITNLCKQLIPEVIVMGTRGNGNNDIFEGSMAKKIMNKAITPVIAVPKEYEDQTEQRIMYACNNHNKDYAKIKLLAKLFENIPTNISVVHFHFEGNKDKNMELIVGLKEVFEIENNKNISFSFVDTTNKTDALQSFVSDNDINSIAFIAHKSNFFKSLFKETITKHDFFKLELPLIALHE